MNFAQFDALTQSLSAAGSRRTVLAAVLAGVVATWLGLPEMEAKKKGKKRQKKKRADTASPPLALSPPPPPPPCEGKADGTDCGGGKQCSGGVCATRPVCTNDRCVVNGNCCSDHCNVTVCLTGGPGKPCHGDAECTSNTCVGFVCQ